MKESHPDKWQWRADEGRSAEILGRIPADRWGTPEDLSGATVFLASATSDYIIN